MPRTADEGGEAVILTFYVPVFIVGLVLGAWLADNSPRNKFYKAYFQQKQYNAGKDPEQVLKGEGV